ncbi:hypothetical protein D3C76_1752820 [compost metagenome]
MDPVFNQLESRQILFFVCSGIVVLHDLANTLFHRQFKYDSYAGLLLLHKEVGYNDFANPLALGFE